MKQLIVLMFASAVLCTTAAAQQRRAVPVASDRPEIDVESYSVDITLEPENHRLIGKAEIRFKPLDRQNYAVFDLDRRLRVAFVSIGGSQVRFRQFDVDSTIEVDLSSQQFDSNPVVHIEYAGILEPEEERRTPFLARVSDDSAFLLYEGKWFPMNGLYKDKAEMRLRVAAPAGWTLVTDLSPSADGFSSSYPSHWGTVTAGAYTTTKLMSEKGEISVNSLKADPEAVNVLGEVAGKVFDFYTEKFGPAPSSSLRVVEVEGANWSSQWSIGTLLLPSSQFRKDYDAPALATAIARQWFPLKVAPKDPSADAWLVDGMAAFASLLYFERALSPADAQEHIHRALVKALGYEGSTTIRQAGGLEKNSPEYHSLVEYKGAYVFRMLRWMIGDEKFDEFLMRYMREFQDKPASTEEVELLASEVAGGDLHYFFDQWVNSSGVPEFTLDYAVFRQKDGYAVRGQVKQDLDLFQMPVEFQIQTDGEPEYARVVVVGEATEFDVKVDRKPKGVVIDPREKVLRMSGDIRVAVLINRGEELSGQGQYNAAIDEFQRAIDIDQRNSLALFRMGETLFELGNVQAAALQFQEALNGDLKPKWVEVWAYINRGKIYDIRGQRDRAVSEYQKAVNTGDDAYGAQAEAERLLKEPFRRQGGRPTIG